MSLDGLRPLMTKSIITFGVSSSEDEPTPDEVLQKLRKRRLLLKDDIAALIAKEQEVK